MSNKAQQLTNCYELLGKIRKKYERNGWSPLPRLHLFGDGTGAFIVVNHLTEQRLSANFSNLDFAELILTDYLAYGPKSIFVSGASEMPIAKDAVSFNNNIPTDLGMEKLQSIFGYLNLIKNKFNHTIRASFYHDGSGELAHAGTIRNFGSIEVAASQLQFYYENGHFR